MLQKLNDPDELQKKWNCTNKRAIVSVVVAGILVGLLLALILIVKYTNSGSDQYPWDNTTRTLRIVSRSEWMAQPPKCKSKPLELPSRNVIIAHTATENCTTQAVCANLVRAIQKFGIESQEWADIEFHFLVGGDGAVYVGRGWDVNGPYNERPGFFKNSIWIAFIGTFNEYAPPQRQLEAALQMIDEGVELNKLTPDYDVFGHRQFVPSHSPGLALYRIIQNWDHWGEIT